MKPKFQVVALGLMLSLGVLAAGTVRPVAGKSVLTIGRATINPSREQAALEPLAVYLASRLKDVGVTRGEVLLASDNRDATIIQYLREGKLDFVLDAAFAAYRYKNAAKATPILLSSVNGGTDHSSYIFVRKDSGITSLEQLKGKVIAFEEEDSTSGYSLPRLSAEAQGIRFSYLASPDALVPPGTVGYVFAGSNINVAAWVYYRKVDAGAMGGLAWSSKRNPKAYKTHANLIYQTEKIPTMLVIARNGLERRVIARAKEELLKLSDTREGQEVLEKLNVTRFLDLPEEMTPLFKSTIDLLRLSRGKTRQP